uniref:Lipocalin n=1 Tax=Rhipicephalus zambeziensis TaxID=60191 RepID=A0A224YID9_9ACAR
MKMLIAFIPLVSYASFCYCQSVLEVRSSEDEIDNPMKLLKGQRPLYLVRAVTPSNMWTENNQYICWNSTKKTDLSGLPMYNPGPSAVTHDITYYHVTQSGSPELGKKLGVWTVSENRVILQTRVPETEPKIRSEWSLVEAQRHCMVLGKNVNTNRNPTKGHRKCEDAYESMCEASSYPTYNWLEKCDEHNKPKGISR